MHRSNDLWAHTLNPTSPHTPPHTLPNQAASRVASVTPQLNIKSGICSYCTRSVTRQRNKTPQIHHVGRQRLHHRARWRPQKDSRESEKAPCPRGGRGRGHCHVRGSPTKYAPRAMDHFCAVMCDHPADACTHSQICCRPSTHKDQRCAERHWADQKGQPRDSHVDRG